MIPVLTILYILIGGVVAFHQMTVDRAWLDEASHWEMFCAAFIGVALWPVVLILDMAFFAPARRRSRRNTRSF